MKSSLRFWRPPPTFREAAIACIVRDRHLLLIKRASRDQDPWSGDVALPGGMREKDETSPQAAIRETFEEVGFKIDKAHYDGRLLVRKMQRGKKSVEVHPHIFLADNLNEWNNLKINEDEVSAAWWSKLDDIATSEVDTKTISLNYTRLRNYLRSELYADFVSSLLSLFGVDAVHFRCVRLPTNRMLALTTAKNSSLNEDSYVLWGMTYGVVLELCETYKLSTKIPAKYKSITRENHVHATCVRLGFAVNNYNMNRYMISVHRWLETMGMESNLRSILLVSCTTLVCTLALPLAFVAYIVW